MFFQVGESISRGEVAAGDRHLVVSGQGRDAPRKRARASEVLLVNRSPRQAAFGIRAKTRRRNAHEREDGLARGLRHVFAGGAFGSEGVG